MFHEGRQIGPYKLSRRLGRGGFGEVWLGERHGKFATTQVAVKLPLDEQVDHAAIEHEAQLWAKASGHPNVLPIIEADEYDGQIVIVSEYAPDGSLEDWLKTHGKMSVEKSVETTIQILDGLAFLHSRNIIHRDLKPANILLQGKTPRLADFGISRAMRTTAASQSQNISGTFAYMSPEALDGKRSVQTDIWSVGVNLYQFLTGTLPFPHKEPSALFPAIIMREFVPLPDSVPSELKEIIAKSLAKLPENRYKTVDELRGDLRQFLHGKSQPILSEIPPTEPLSDGSEPVADNPNSAITDIKVPFETNETETTIRPVLSQNKTSVLRLLITLNNEKLPKWIPVLVWGIIGAISGVIMSVSAINAKIIAPSIFLIIIITTLFLSILVVPIYLFGEYSKSPRLGKRKKITSFLLILIFNIIGFIAARFFVEEYFYYYDGPGYNFFFFGTIWAFFIILAELICWNFNFQRWLYGIFAPIILGASFLCLAYFFEIKNFIAIEDSKVIGLFTGFAVIVLLFHAIVFSRSSNKKEN